MNQNELYAADQLKILIWSGFYDIDQVNEALDDILEEDIDEEKLQKFIDEQFYEKRVQEKDWPSKTDCDRLDALFQELNESMIIALQNAGFTNQDGLGDVRQIWSEQPSRAYRGYCFYHQQSMASALAGRGLLLSYGDLANTDEGTLAIAGEIVSALERHGFRVDWDGSAQTKINVPLIKWHRRGKRKRS
ncbi:hypothetical protein PQR62_09340 [Herbaspirillum lusitanum]|uniref:DUF6891 domain-containing protein n=1 Tax=Herbaspirillum lusitanum TaxID=213312 RepID=A0ABW9A8D7_9BURK